MFRAMLQWEAARLAKPKYAFLVLLAGAAAAGTGGFASATMFLAAGLGWALSLLLTGAGAERERELHLIYSRPLARSRFVMARYAAGLASGAAAGAVAVPAVFCWYLATYSSAWLVWLRLIAPGIFEYSPGLPKVFAGLMLGSFVGSGLAILGLAHPPFPLRLQWASLWPQLPTLFYILVLLISLVPPFQGLQPYVYTWQAMLCLGLINAAACFKAFGSTPS
jgi:hypothetical protein